MEEVIDLQRSIDDLEMTKAPGLVEVTSRKKSSKKRQINSLFVHQLVKPVSR